MSSTHRVTLVAALLLVASSAAQGAEGPECVVVIGTNDLHGAIDEHELDVGNTKLRYGGLLVMASYIDILRQHYGKERVLLLDGGDLYQGALASNLSEGAAVVDAMNYMGYEAVAIGNHEFDFGAGMSWARAHPGEVPPLAERLDVLFERMRQAHFPFLAVNIRDKATHLPVSWPNSGNSIVVYKAAGAELAHRNPTPRLVASLMTQHGIKVGVIGAATPDTPRVTRPVNVVALEFAEPAPLIVAEARKLRAAGAKLIVLVAHMGGKCGDLHDPNNTSTCDTDQEIYQLLHTMPESTVDVVVAGHTHQYMAHWMGGAAVIEAGARGRALAWVEACVGKGGRFDKEHSKIHAPVTLCRDEWQSGGCYKRKKPEAVVPARFLGQPVVPPPALTQLLAPYREAVAAEVARPLGVRLAAPLLREAPDGSRPLGDLIAEALRVAAGADVGVQNVGGVRADLPAGEVTFGQVFEVLPFDNRLAVLDLTGSELNAFIAKLVERRAGLIPHVAGITVRKLDKGGVQLTFADGSSVEATHHYKVATNDFLALGGEGLDQLFGSLPKERRVVRDEEMRDAFITYLQSHMGAAK